MITIKEKQRLLSNLASQGKIISIEFNSEIHEIILKKLKNEYLKFFIISIFVSIFSFLVFVFLLFFQFFGKMIYIRALALVFSLLPILVLFEYLKKSKHIKKKNYKCYIGVVEQVFNDGSYKILEIDLGENLKFAKLAEPTAGININDKVIIVNILDDIFLLDYQLLIKK